MSDTKNCPYCGEEVLIAAKKCKHCGEWLNKISVDASKKIVDAGKKIKEKIKMSKLSKKVTASIIIGTIGVGALVGAGEGHEAGATKPISVPKTIFYLSTAIERDTCISQAQAENMRRGAVRGGFTGAAIGVGLGTLVVLGVNVMKGQKGNSAEQATSGAPSPEREGNTYDARENF